MQDERYSDGAAAAYDAMASIYDEFNAANDYEVWLGEVLLPELEKHGLRRGSVLDVGCGTGRAFEPLMRRGWKVYGCDTSSEMLSLAASRAGELAKRYKSPSSDPLPGVPLLMADARELPDRFRPLDLILALNDVVNYLTEDGDLERCFSGVKRNLAEGGLVCFDANTLGLFEGSWVANGSHGASRSNAPLEERGWEWTGLTTDPRPGGTFEGELAGQGIEGPSVHRERHWTRDQIETAMGASGLRSLAVLGQREEPGCVLLEDPPDEHRHYKTVWVGGHVD